MYEDLKDKNLIEETPLYKDEIMHLLDAAEKDLKTASSLQNTDCDWAFNIAYNAVFRVSLACMYAKGYRPRGENKHKVTIVFLKKALGKSFENALDRADDIRKKRNRITYQASLEIGKYEMRETLKFAAEYVKAITELIKGNIG